MNNEENNMKEMTKKELNESKSENNLAINVNEKDVSGECFKAELKCDNIEEEYSKRLLPHKIFSTVLFTLLLSFFNGANLNIFEDNVKCFRDRLFEATAFFHNLMVASPTLQDIVMIVAGLAEDFAVILGCAFFVFKFKSMRVMMGLTAVYASRAVFQNIYLMEIPKESTFRYPGFISLFVPYFQSNDYFYSGHVSLPTVISYEFWKIKYYWTAVLVFHVGLLQLGMMLWVRGHYGIDMYAGFIFSFYFCQIANMNVHYVDKSIIGLYYEPKDENNNELENRLIVDNSKEKNYNIPLNHESLDVNDKK